MAVVTLYSLANQIDDHFNIAITGQIKRKVKSVLDDDWGESLSPIPSIFKTIKSDDKVYGRFMTVLMGLEHMVRLKAGPGDRCYYWGIDKDIITLINTNQPFSLINEMKSMGIDEDEAPILVKKIYDIKTKLGVRLGYQDPKKINRFVDYAKQMLSKEEAPKSPPFETALERARKRASKSNELSQLDKLQEEKVNENKTTTTIS